MKYVLFYANADAPAELTQQLLPAHRARWGEFQHLGSLLAIGPFTDGTGAMGVFGSREAAEEFAAGDPFVLHGVVGKWHVTEWMEAILGP
jgi:uncharacterized protein YciI